MRIVSAIVGLTLLWIMPAWGQTARPAGEMSIDEILSGVEKRYAGAGFKTRFEQQSLLKAMDITDTARGELLIKRPGKMRWIYQSPEEQLIITDGDRLWVFRPGEKQVMVGKAPAFFGEGKGAGFLSDIQQIRNHFDVSSADANDPNKVGLKLVPFEKQFDVDRIFLKIDKTTFEITDVTTLNAYDDETRIQLSDYAFDQKLDDGLFTFQVPEGTDIVEMAE